jgi:uncharacterized protein YlxW (UPF0749 family)
LILHVDFGVKPITSNQTGFDFVDFLKPLLRNPLAKSRLPVEGETLLTEPVSENEPHSKSTHATAPEPFIAAIPVPIPVPVATSSPTDDTPKVSKAAYVTFLFLFLGGLGYLIFALCIHHIQVREDTGQAPTRRVQDLVNLVSQAETKEKKLEDELVRLRRRLIQIDGNTPNADSANSPDQANLPNYQKLLALGGLTPITGDGVILTLKNPTNSPGRTDSAGNRPDGVQNSLQSEDILKLVNDLKAAGATAISINGERIITTTEIVNSGPSIMVNQTRINIPIQIRAVGPDPKVMADSLNLRGGILEYLQFFGITATVVQKQNLTIEAYNGTL